jgi:hypothetical protein
MLQHGWLARLMRVKSGQATEAVPQYDGAGSRLLRILLMFFSVYLILGSIPRVIELSESGNTIPITEPMLMVLGIGILGMYPAIGRVVLRDYMPFGLVITLSLVYGVFLNGFLPKPAVFNIRMQLQLLVALAFGRLFFVAYGDRVASLVAYYFWTYVGVAVLGLVIFLLFPSALDFYEFLRVFGIHYVGDPHVYRFISPYLDPNLYGAMVIFPILLAIFLFWTGGEKKYAWGCLFLLGTLALTVSRSGLGSAALLLMIVGARYLMGVARRGIVIKRSVLRKLKLPALLLGVGLAIAAPVIGQKIAARFEQPVAEEGSALMRLESFLIGLRVMSEHPFFGVGYNYGVIAAEERTLPSEHEGVQIGFDSSLQTMLVNFGAIPTLALGYWALRWYRRAASHFRNAGTARAGHSAILGLLGGYVVLCVGFTAQFNNVALYQFWLTPVLALAAYLSACVSSDIEALRRTRIVN